MKKYLFPLLLIVILALLLCSCAGMRTGYYTIKEIRGLNTVVFKELPNDAYHVPNADTLVIGQRIYLKRVFCEDKATIWMP